MDIDIDIDDVIPEISSSADDAIRSSSLPPRALSTNMSLVSNTPSVKNKVPDKPDESTGDPASASAAKRPSPTRIFLLLPPVLLLLLQGTPRKAFPLLRLHPLLP